VSLSPRFRGYREKERSKKTNSKEHMNSLYVASESRVRTNHRTFWSRLDAQKKRPKRQRRAAEVKKSYAVDVRLTKGAFKG